MTLGERFQTLRLAAGWSQEQMAEKLNVARQTISKWERGLSTPDVDTLVVLSGLFGLSLDELIRGAGGTAENRALDLEQLAAKNRRSYRRTVIAVVGACFSVLGCLALVFVKTLDLYLLRSQYMLYRYITTGEYTYRHEGVGAAVAVAAVVAALGVLLMAGLLWKRERK